jgi:hypothetical protein
MGMVNSSPSVRHAGMGADFPGWLLRLQEVRQEDWPDEHWCIDHSRDDAIAWVAQFSISAYLDTSLFSPLPPVDNHLLST